MEVMYDRKGNRVEVFGIDVDHDMAMVYNACQASHCSGNGWQKISLKKLIPEAYFDPVNQKYMSKTERNDIKSKLKLIDAIWECEDGARYTHQAIEEAIVHQKELMANGVSDERTSKV